jgi:hypothetical protein
VGLAAFSSSATAAASEASRSLSCTVSFGDGSSGCARGLDRRFLVCSKLVSRMIQ